MYSICLRHIYKASLALNLLGVKNVLAVELVKCLGHTGEAETGKSLGLPA